MKILSKMLSKKSEPRAAADPERDEDRLTLDDAGQLHRSRDALADPEKPINPRPEEPEVAGSGWAAGDDWDDNWDDDEEWGDDDDAGLDIEERRRTEDRQHLVSEIREAMVSVSHVQPEDRGVHSRNPVRSDWGDEADFGRRARARSQLTAAADEAEDRILEKTETAMSDRETSRRRSAMAHMKAAAAATKADRVLRHVASRDPAGDPAEQSPYRDDLAKVVRPHSTSRPISRQVSRPASATPVWDRGAGDEDAALFAAAGNGLREDPSNSIENELAAEEEARLARAPAPLSAEEFQDDDNDLAPSPAAREFPSSRFAVPLEAEAEDEALDRNAFDDFEDDDADLDDFDDDDDFAPRPSRVVSEAVAFANAPDDEVEEQPETQVRRKIWEIADQVDAFRGDAASAAPQEPESDPEESAPGATLEQPPENFVQVATAVAGRAGRSAGRVKTRLLGFQADDQAQDIFAATAEKAEGPAQARPTAFPAGWIVVTDGPGRGACFTLHVGVSQIGRGEDQAVRLDFGDTSISRNNHAAVAYDDEQAKFYLGHGGKSNLVRLNGRPVLSTEEMSDGDEIRIGETTLKFVALCGDGFSWSGNGDDAENA